MAAVVIQPYSSDWPGQFLVAREQLLAAFAPLTVTIEHIGSTAVPGLAAKPVLDLLLGAPSLAQIESRIAALARLSYDYVSRYERELPERRYFVKAADGGLRQHLHGVVIGSALWRDHLVFRDRLRDEPALRAQYQALKRQLAERFADDKAAYTAAKEPFIRSVLAASADRKIRNCNEQRGKRNG